MCVLGYTRKHGICILSAVRDNPISLLLNDSLLSLVKPFFKMIYIINSTNTGIPEIEGMRFIKKILFIVTGEMKIQIRFTLSLSKIRNHCNVIVFFIGGNTLLLPIILSKLFRKKTLLIVTGSPSRIIRTKSKIASAYYAFLERVCYTLVDVIVVYAHSIITDYHLERFQKKIYLGARYVNLDCFRQVIPLSQRRDTFGFVGRFAPEKGILELLESVPIIQSNNPDKRLKFVIIGEGPLKCQIEQKLKNSLATIEIELLGKIPHEELPLYLNQMKFLICPSHSEGLPNVILEAMACGTIVVATPVGGIREIVKDDKTGFLIKETDPTQIAYAITRAIQSDNLNNISKQAKEFVEKGFSYCTALERYKMIFEALRAQKNAVE